MDTKSNASLKPVTEPERQPHPSSFVRWLEGQGCLANCDAEFKELVRTVKEMGRPGAMTLTISVKPSGDGRLKLGEKLNVKLPKYDSEERTFFADDDGTLSKQNPKQRVMQLPKPDDAGPTEPKSA